MVERNLPKLVPEPAPVYVRVHTQVRNQKPRPDQEDSYKWLGRNNWANFALVFDCETTTDLRLNLNFLWWRFCELKDGIYAPQREGIACADDLDAKSVSVIRDFLKGKRADVEEGCPTDI